jgi:hypothetical protein
LVKILREKDLYVSSSVCANKLLVSHSNFTGMDQLLQSGIHARMQAQIIFGLLICY